MSTDAITEILGHFRHEHLPPRLAAVSRRIGDVARELTAGTPEDAAVRLLACANELAASLPRGWELVEGLMCLAQAAQGLPGDVTDVIRGLAGGVALDLQPIRGSTTYGRLRSLLRAKDALVRAEVARPAASLGGPAALPCPDDRGHGMLVNERREG